MIPVAIDSEIWWLVRPDDIRPVKGLSIHDIVKAIQEAFTFAAFPIALPAEGQGFVFREGVFRTSGTTIAITRLDLFNDGLHLDVSSTTDDAEAVFEKLREIFLKLGAKPIDVPLLQYHVSRIVCELASDAEGLVSEFTQFSEMISTHLDIKAAVGLRSMVFSADAKTLPAHVGRINPTQFLLERRFDAALSERRYYSAANMTTSKHIEVLSWIEDRLAART